LRRCSALLGCLPAVIPGELSIPRHFSDDLPHRVPRVAGYTRHQIDHFRVPRIGGAVALIGHLIASEGGDIPIVSGRIARRRDLRALLRGLPAHLRACIATSFAAVVCLAATAAGQVEIRRCLILVRCCLIKIRRSLINYRTRLLAVRPKLIVVRTVLVAVRGRLFKLGPRPVAFRFTCCGHLVSLTPSNNEPTTHCGLPVLACNVLLATGRLLPRSVVFSRFSTLY
jgi:hypothetical protein